MGAVTATAAGGLCVAGSRHMTPRRPTGQATAYEAVRCRLESCRGDDHHQVTGESSEMEQISKRLINWASILEDKTRQQAVTTSLMPFIYPHVALMPDAHLGKGATVGSVIPTLGAIIPA